MLAKTDLLGNLIGYAGGLVGHLGCIDINPEDGKVYGSLELKNDAIGQGIFKTLGKEGAPAEDAFYVAIFDVDKITRPAMDAEKDGIMTAVWLPDVVEDTTARAFTVTVAAGSTARRSAPCSAPRRIPHPC